MTPGWSPSDELLSRFLRADCTSDESRAVQRWLAQSADHARRLEGLRRLFGRSEGSPWDVDRMWEKIRAETLDANRPAVPHQALPRRMPRVAFQGRSWRTPIAASLLFALIGTASWMEFRSRTPEPAPTALDVTYQTRRGQTATVQLSDGSRVRLAPQSRLVIAAGFGNSLRELTLDGEAAFDVRHDAARPFRVRTATTVTEDVGTRFGVRAYRSEQQVTVAVSEGAVALSRRVGSEAHQVRPTGVLLRAGDLGTLDPAGHIATAHGVAVGRALAWTRNELVFAKQPLSEVLATLARWYDLDIHVADPTVAAHPVTAEFSTQSPDEMLQALAMAVDGVVERDGRHVILKGRQ